MTTLAPFPADDPIWNTAATNRVTPTAGKQAAGFGVDEEPVSGEFNWFFAYVSEYILHYKTAVVLLNNEKVDVDGDARMDGTYRPSFDGIGNLGIEAFSYNEIWGYTIATNLLKPRTGVSTADVGVSTARFRKGWFEDFDIADDLSALNIFFETLSGNVADIGALDITTAILPSAPGGAVNGSNAFPWDTLTSRIAHANYLTAYNDDQPASQGDLNAWNQLNLTLAQCRVSGAAVGAGAGTAGLLANFNILTIQRTGAGRYTIVFRQPVDANASLTVSINNASITPNTARNDRAVITGGGTGAQVLLNEALVSAGTTSAGDNEFSLQVIGAPQTLVVSPIV